MFQLYFEDQLRSVEDQFKNFMRNGNMPEYTVELFTPSLEEANQNGFGSCASVNYNPSKNKHVYKVWPVVFQDVRRAEPLLFHELTHMLDIEKFCSGDKNAYFCLRGYMEYHAAQVDLSRGLGTQFWDEVPEFSIHDKVNMYPDNLKVIDWLESTHAMARDIISKPDFPVSYQVLSGAIGILCNFLGRLSICDIFAVDADGLPDTLRDTTLERKILGEEYEELEKLFVNFLSDELVCRTFDPYYHLMMKLALRIH